MLLLYDMQARACPFAFWVLRTSDCSAWDFYMGLFLQGCMYLYQYRMPKPMPDDLVFWQRESCGFGFPGATVENSTLHMGAVVEESNTADPHTNEVEGIPEPHKAIRHETEDRKRQTMDPSKPSDHIHANTSKTLTRTSMMLWVEQPTVSTAVPLHCGAASYCSVGLGAANALLIRVVLALSRKTEGPFDLWGVEQERILETVYSNWENLTLGFGGES